MQFGLYKSKQRYIELSETNYTDISLPLRPKLNSNAHNKCCPDYMYHLWSPYIFDLYDGNHISIYALSTAQ